MLINLHIHCRGAGRPRAVPVIAVLLALSFPASAQAPQAPAFDALPSIVVTATRSPQPLQDALADVTVIDRDEIERAGPGGLVALLQRQPGAEITRNGGPGAVSSLFLRGANGGQTIVLIDGVRVGSASTGAATLEAIPLEQIDRIEILRGPASSLYGADAIGGVVQVFTRQPGGASGGRLTGNARLGYGTHATREASAGVSGMAGPLQFAVQGAHQASRGFNAVDDPQAFNFNPDRDGYHGDSGSVSLALPWAPGQSLRANYLRNRLNAQFDGGPGHDDRTITVVEATDLESRNRLHEHWTTRLVAAESVDDSLSRTGFGDFPFRTRDRRYTWLNDFPWTEATLSLGLERREERVTTDSAFAVTARNTDALLALFQWHRDAQALEASVRRDRSDQFGGRTTGGVSYGYRVLPSVRLTAGASTAFKVPSFNDLYYPGFSNPGLAPERARNVEMGITWNGQRELAGRALIWEARAVLYRNRVRDLIVFQCDADFNCAPQNVSRATLEGVTLSLQAHHAATTLSASLDLQDPHDDPSGRLLPRRARRHGVLDVAHRWGPLRLGMEALASSRRYDDAENTRPLAGYAILNLTGEYELGQGWSALLRADNVFDRDYRLAASYATGGAGVFVALRWQH